MTTTRADLERLLDAVATLESIAAHRDQLDALSAEDRRRFLRAVELLRGPSSRTRRRMIRADTRRERLEREARDRAARAETGIQHLRRKPVYTTPNYFPPEKFEARDVHEDGDAAAAAPDTAPQDRAQGARRVATEVTCYVCKRRFLELHHFYDQLCPPCAAFNFAKRTETADLRGRVALLTGGRVKIGYQAGLKLLRAGAHLAVTTRFPRDSATRYASEPDFADWHDRLEIFGLDLRHTPSVEAFCRTFAASHGRLDFIINNACQTVRRPPEFYAHMMAAETAAVARMPAHVRRLLPQAADGAITTHPGRVPDFAPGLTHAPHLSQVPLLPEELLSQKALFPDGQFDQDLQQVDLRDRNSWRLLLDEVSAVELLEVHLVNAVAPFIVNARLKPLMQRTPERDKHIVNVSAVEGQFYRPFKTTRHPHTNMAKAALNMMTRTAALDYYTAGIHMNSVDTGWVTDEDPVAIAARKTAEQGFHPPLDIVDGAARIVDPIISGLNTGTHVWGKFLKDYQATDW